VHQVGFIYKIIQGCTVKKQKKKKIESILHIRHINPRLKTSYHMMKRISKKVSNITTTYYLLKCHISYITLIRLYYYRSHQNRQQDTLTISTKLPTIYKFLQPHLWYLSRILHLSFILFYSIFYFLI